MRRKFTKLQALRAAERLRIPMSRVSFTLDDFWRGMNVELEHRDVTHGNVLLTAKIAYAHLRESPKYYRALRTMEKKLMRSGDLVRGHDIFKRTPFESSDDMVEFKRALSREIDDVPFERGAERFAPGPDIARFYKTKPKRRPETETEKLVFAAILEGPLSMGYWSNFLIYGTPLRRVDIKTKKAFWSLVRGGALKAVRSYRPDNYWILANP